jgi:hypothetical protein
MKSFQNNFKGASAFFFWASSWFIIKKEHFYYIIPLLFDSAISYLFLSIIYLNAQNSFFISS